MKKQDNIIIWIIGIAIVFLVLTQTNIFKKQEAFGLNVHYYKDGVEVFPTKDLFSVVKGTYDEIAFAIYGSETGGTPITDLIITDASPQPLKDALPTTIQTLNALETDK